MKQSVRDHFLDFNRDLEGVFAHIYLDTKGLPTIAIGYQIMHLEDALSLPFEVAGEPATTDSIRADWARITEPALVREQIERHKQGKAWAAPYFAQFTRIRLPESGLQKVCERRLEANEAIVKRYLPRWGSWPADAQLALLSMCWAAGVGRVLLGFPKFMGWAKQDPPKFYGCAAESGLSEKEDKNIWKRNARQRACFRNAAVVQANNWNPAELHFPHQLSDVRETKPGWEPKFKPQISERT